MKYNYEINYTTSNVCSTTIFPILAERKRTMSGFRSIQFRLPVRMALLSITNQNSKPVLPLILNYFICVILAGNISKESKKFCVLPSTSNNPLIIISPFWHRLYSHLGTGRRMLQEQSILEHQLKGSAEHSRVYYKVTLLLIL